MILVIIALIIGNEFPKPLWLVISICYLFNTIAIVSNYMYSRKNKRKDISKETR